MSGWSGGFIMAHRCQEGTSEVSDPIAGSGTKCHLGQLTAWSLASNEILLQTHFELSLPYPRPRASLNYVTYDSGKLYF